MRRWRIVDPGPNLEPIETIMTEEDILKEYWPWWKSKMEELGRTALIDEENCIDDWVVVHWAEEITNE